MNEQINDLSIRSKCKMNEELMNGLLAGNECCALAQNE